jgi:hypothetical protein
VPGRLVFEHVVAALVHGSGYERIATPGCSDRTIRIPLGIASAGANQHDFPLLAHPASRQPATGRDLARRAHLPPGRRLRQHGDPPAAGRAGL